MSRNRNYMSRLLGFVLLGCLLVPAAVAQGSVNSICTPDAGQVFIAEGRYDKAVQAFTCVIAGAPTEAAGYRGRAEAEVLLGRYSDAMADYGRITALVEPVHPDARQTIIAEYDARLAQAPNDVAALTGAGFARWEDFQYPQAIKVLDHLLEVHPEDPFATLFRGSSRVLKGVNKGPGLADLERAIQLAPTSPDVRWLVADAYTYGQPDPQRAFAEATLALQWGVDTPRVHAILAAALNAFGQTQAAAAHIAAHLELVATQLVPTSPLDPGAWLTLDLGPGRVYSVPVPAVAGQTISISTGSKDYWDSIAVLLSPDGTPIVGSDDDSGYFAAFDWVAQETGTYSLRATFFEAVNTGQLVVKRG